MLRKIGASLLFVVAGLGLLLCLAGSIGVWVANTPVTDTLTATLSAASGYLQLGGSTAALASDQVEAVRQQLEEVQSTVASMPPGARADVASQVGERITSHVMPAITLVHKTIAAVSAAAVALNKSLESANRIPGVNVPTYTDELQTADQTLDEIGSELTAAAAELADVSVDGSKIAASFTATSAKLASIQALLDRWTQQIAQADQALAAAEAAAPPLIDWTSVALSLLFLLFGAGQLCLMATAIRQLRA
jgi:hypothetical protein